MTSRLRQAAWTTAALLFVAASRHSAAPSVDQATPKPVLRGVWDKSYGADSLFTEFRAISTAANDGVLVGASERDAADASASSASRLLLWRIDAAGQVTSEAELKASPASKGTNTAAIRDLRALDGGEVLVLVDFEGGRPSVVRVDRSGKQTATSAVMAPGRSATLSKMVTVSGNRFLLIGHESLDALLVAIDAAGNVLWEKKQDRGRMDFFVDGVSLPDGSSVLVGNSGKYDALRSGPSVMWIGHYDTNGNPKAEMTFPGRFGRIARAGGGGYAVVYDQSESTEQRVHIKRLGSDLKETWDVPLLKTGPNFSDFKLAALPGGGFVVAGGRDGQSYLTVLDANGQQTSTLIGEAVERALDIGGYGLAYSDSGSLFLASSHIEARSKDNIRQKVRLRKVAM
jgi:hypothetical protein